MIAHINGSLGERWGDGACIVRVASGLGYELILPAHTWSALPAPGSEVAFYVSMVTREDACELFGFATFEEKRTFEILKGISRIGPRTALAILGVFRPQDLSRIAAEGNLAALAKVSGIGKKTAQHLLLELKYKLKDAPQGEMPADASATSPQVEDVVAVLVNLGYDEDECGRMVREIIDAEPDLDDSEIVRAALKIMAKGKA